MSSLPICGRWMLAVLALGLCGCSGFDRAWNDAGTGHTGIEGRWQGNWKSEVDGHTGALLCVIKQTGPTSYDAFFNATFFGIFHFSYDAKLAGEQRGTIVHLLGEQDLGWPVGVYHYDGTANEAQFFCAYRAGDDHGYFSLARPGGAPPTTQLAPSRY